MQKIDLLVKNGTVVTMNDRMQIVENGAIAIHKGNILAIDDEKTLTNQYTADSTHDARGGIILPGLINAHTHIAMSYFKGVADDMALQNWLQNFIWPLEGKFLCEEFIYHASLHGVAEMIRNGVTTFCDMYFMEAATTKACIEAGIRGVLGEGVVEFPVVNYTKAEQMIDYAVEQHHAFKDNDLIRFMPAPHSIYACNREHLIMAAKVARDNDMHLLIHLAETSKERDDAIGQYGKSPVRYLDEIGFLGDNLICAHGVWVDEEEQRILAERGTGVVICTESNLKLASGIAPIKGYQANNVRLCFGTDGVASNNNLSIVEEMGTTAKLHKAVNNDPTFLPAETALRMATIEAAKILGMADRTGSLEVGKAADFIVLHSGTVETEPIYSVYSHLCYNMNSGNISDVFVSGKPVMLGRKLTTLDETELLDRARSYRKKILETI